MFMIEDRVFILDGTSDRNLLEKWKPHLAGRIDDITVVFDAFVVDALGVSVLDGRVVGFYEMVLGILNDEGGLS